MNSGRVKTIPFLKMQGIGNDFVVIDDLARPEPSPITPEVVRKIADRRYGVGADQILWLRKPHAAAADARMEILNSDGSSAEMCGNGIRAVGVYLYRHGPKPSQGRYLVETLAGLLPVEVTGGADAAMLVSVEMGKPVLGGGFAEEIIVGDQKLMVHEVSMGNPHAVIFVEDAETFPVEKFGPVIETHRRFPKRTNVEFVQVINEREIRVRVWERGAGITLACGTGACASAVAALATGRVKGEVTVQLPGGTLWICWEGDDSPVIMRGPAEEVFRGEFHL